MPRKAQTPAPLRAFAWGEHTRRGDTHEHERNASRRAKGNKGEGDCAPLTCTCTYPCTCPASEPRGHYSAVQEQVEVQVQRGLLSVSSFCATACPAPPRPPIGGPRSRRLGIPPLPPAPWWW